MAAFARHDGPHARAIKAVREGLWFQEELYARFNVIRTTGTWNGGVIASAGHLQNFNDNIKRNLFAFLYFNYLYKKK